jgi:hypothetical protein
VTPRDVVAYIQAQMDACAPQADAAELAAMDAEPEPELEAGR